jgi:hypothetical protein
MRIPFVGVRSIGRFPGCCHSSTRVLRSTMQRLGMTLKVCISLRLAI